MKRAAYKGMDESFFVRMMRDTGLITGKPFSTWNWPIILDMLRVRSGSACKLALMQRGVEIVNESLSSCLLYTSPSPRD